MIHTFGDSHASTPWGKIHGVSYNWTKGTAYKFGLHKERHINITEPIFKIQDNDFIIFSFGFLDCKSYIKPLSEEFNIKWQDCIDTIVEDYISAIEVNKNKFNNLQIGVLKIPSFVKGLPSEDDDLNPERYPTRCLDEERKAYTEYFNEQLKHFCDTKKYKFIDFFDRFNDKHGYLEEVYTDEHKIHISPHLDFQNYLLKNFKEHFEKNPLYENRTNVGRAFVSNISKDVDGETIYTSLSDCIVEMFSLENNKIKVTSIAT